MARRSKSARTRALACLSFVFLSPLGVQAGVMFNGGFELPPPFNFVAAHSPDQAQPRPGWIASGHADGHALGTVQTLTNGTASEGLNYVRLHVRTDSPGGGDAHLFLLSNPIYAIVNDVLSFDYRGNAQVIAPPSPAAEMHVTIWNGNHTAIVTQQNLVNSANWTTLNYVFANTGNYLLEFFVHTDSVPLNPFNPGGPSGRADVGLDIDHVHITPEPSTLLVWAAGLLIIPALWRRMAVGI
jgi:hypothetical protein